MSLVGSFKLIFGSCAFFVMTDTVLSFGSLNKAVHQMVFAQITFVALRNFEVEVRGTQILSVIMCHNRGRFVNREPG